MIDLTVKTPDSRNIRFSVPDGFTILNLKHFIAEKVNIEASKQRIIYLGRVLADEAKLSSCSVQGNVVHVVETSQPPDDDAGPGPSTVTGSTSRAGAWLRSGESAARYRLAREFSVSMNDDFNPVAFLESGGTAGIPVTEVRISLSSDGNANTTTNVTSSLGGASGSTSNSGAATLRRPSDARRIAVSLRLRVARHMLREVLTIVDNLESRNILPSPNFRPYSAILSDRGRNANGRTRYLWNGDEVLLVPQSDTEMGETGSSSEWQLERGSLEGLFGMSSAEASSVGRSRAEVGRSRVEALVGRSSAEASVERSSAEASVGRSSSAEASVGRSSSAEASVGRSSSAEGSFQSRSSGEDNGSSSVFEVRFPTTLFSTDQLREMMSESIMLRDSDVDASTILESRRRREALMEGLVRAENMMRGEEESVDVMNANVPSADLLEGIERRLGLRPLLVSNPANSEATANVDAPIRIVADIPIADIPIAGIPIASIPMASIPMANRDGGEDEGFVDPEDEGPPAATGRHGRRTRRGRRILTTRPRIMRPSSSTRQDRPAHRIPAPTARELSTLFTVLSQLQQRLIPFNRVLEMVLNDDPNFAEYTAMDEGEAQILYDAVMEATHYMAHASHAISDLMISFNSRPPRLIRTYPITEERVVNVQPYMRTATSSGAATSSTATQSSASTRDPRLLSGNFVVESAVQHPPESSTQQQSSGSAASAVRELHELQSSAARRVASAGFIIPANISVQNMTAPLTGDLAADINAAVSQACGVVLQSLESGNPLPQFISVDTNIPVSSAAAASNAQSNLSQNRTEWIAFNNVEVDGVQRSSEGTDGIGADASSPMDSNESTLFADSFSNLSSSVDSSMGSSAETLQQGVVRAEATLPDGISEPPRSEAANPSEGRRSPVGGTDTPPWRTVDSTPKSALRNGGVLPRNSGELNSIIDRRHSVGGTASTSAEPLAEYMFKITDRRSRIYAERWILHIHYDTSPHSEALAQRFSPQLITYLMAREVARRPGQSITDMSDEEYPSEVRNLSDELQAEVETLMTDAIRGGQVPPPERGCSPPAHRPYDELRLRYQRRGNAMRRSFRLSPADQSTSSSQSLPRRINIPALVPTPIGFRAQRRSRFDPLLPCSSRHTLPGSSVPPPHVGRVNPPSATVREADVANAEEFERIRRSVSDFSEPVQSIPDLQPEIDADLRDRFVNRFEQLASSVLPQVLQATFSSMDSFMGGSTTGATNASTTVPPTTSGTDNTSTSTPATSENTEQASDNVEVPTVPPELRYFSGEDNLFSELMNAILTDVPFLEMREWCTVNDSFLFLTVRETFRTFVLANFQQFGEGARRSSEIVTRVFNNFVYAMRSSLRSNHFRPDVDVCMTVCKFNCCRLPCIIGAINTLNEDSFVSRFPRLLYNYVQDLAQLLISCLREPSAAILQEAFGPIYSRIAEAFPPQEELRVFIIQKLSNYVQSQLPLDGCVMDSSGLRTRERLTEWARSIIVLRLPESENFEEHEAASSQSIEEGQAMGADENMETDQPQEDESWRMHVPSGWLPIIARDTQRMRRTPPAQQPFSEAYISTMPSKRRKLLNPPSDQSQPPPPPS